MHRTPWVNKNSSLPSDRIKPTVKKPNTAKGKGNQTPPEPPKSRSVRKLETLLNDIKGFKGSEKDPNGGCFCLARIHELSAYIPICHSCGFILCSVNHPRYCCPSCSSTIITHSVRDVIIGRVESELASTIAMELEEKERAIAEAQKVAGAFPQLQGSSVIGLPTTSVPPARQTHKVMSLTSGKSRRVVVSSYTTTPVQSRPASRNEVIEGEPEPERISQPPQEPFHAATTPKSNRPWENLIHGAVPYKQKSRLDDDGSPKGHPRRRRANKGKGKENET